MNKIKIPKFKIDSSYKRRGGTAYWYIIKCKHCGRILCLYQKDGKGNLYRLYADRIVDGDGRRPLSELNTNFHGSLACPSCGIVFAVSMIYEKDIYQRLAFRLIPPGISRTMLKDKKSLCFTGDTLDVFTLLSK